MSSPLYPQRDEHDRRKDVRDTLAGLSEQLGEMHGAFRAHLEAHARAMSWRSPLGIALIGVALTGFGAVVHDQLGQARQRARLDSLVAVAAKHDTADGTLAAGLELSCMMAEGADIRARDTAAPPGYALRALRIAPTCDSLYKLLRRRLDGLAP